MIRYYKKILLLILILGIFIIPISSYINIDDFVSDDQKNYTPWTGNPEVSTHKDVNFTSEYIYFSDLYNGTTKNEPVAGKKYVIENAVDLLNFSILLAEDTTGKYLSLHYLLGKDINFSGGVSSFFKPIGFRSETADDALGFTGVFDGQGFTISGFILEPVTQSIIDSTYGGNLVYYSMFSKINTGGTVKNFTLTNPVYNQFDAHSMLYASYICGYNYGIIENVSVVDTRDASASGIGVRGYFGLAPLVNINAGSMKDMFYAGRRVESIDAIAAAYTRGVDRLVNYQTETGTAVNVYYDKTLMIDTPYRSAIGGIEGTGSETEDLNNPSIAGLNTTQFQDSLATNFGSAWYYNNSFKSGSTTLITTNNTYPTLKGLEVYDTTTFYLNKATDVAYMQYLIDNVTNANNRNYLLYSDIDMKAISRTCLVTPSNEFNGRFYSVTFNASHAVSRRLYENSDLLASSYSNYVLAARTNAYYSLINLHIEVPTLVGTRLFYGLFGQISSTSAKVEYINLINPTLYIQGFDDYDDATTVYAGLLAARILRNDVYDNYAITYAYVSQADISIESGTLANKQFFVGGFVGGGSPKMARCSITGTMDLGTHYYHAGSNDSYFGGIFGYGERIGSTGTNYAYLNRVLNRLDIKGFSYYEATCPAKISIGAVVGGGAFRSLYYIRNEADVYINPQVNSTETYLDEVYYGGICGYIDFLQETTTGTYNTGTPTLRVNQVMKASIGIGVGSLGVDNAARFDSAVNYANLRTYKLVGSSSSMAIDVSGLFIGFKNNTTMYYSHNMEHTSGTGQTIDLSIIRAYAGIYLSNDKHNGTTSSDYRDNHSHTYSNSYVYSGVINTQRGYLLYVSNRKTVNAITTSAIPFKTVKIAGVAVNNATTRSIYSMNDGDINVDITHGTNTPGSGKELLVSGFADDWSARTSGNDNYRNGNRANISVNITMTENSQTGITPFFDFDVKVAGLSNRFHTGTATLAYRGMNDGDVSVIGNNIYGNVQVAGLFNNVTNNISDNYNTANVYGEVEFGKRDASDTAFFLLEAAGIANVTNNVVSGATSLGFGNNGNYGNVASYVKSDNGRAIAAGIVGTNARMVDYSEVSNTTATGLYNNNVFFSNNNNYGQIYAWSNAADTNYIADLPNSIAGGIVGYGSYRLIYNINYGQVYSKTTSGGIVGVLDRKVLTSTTGNSYELRYNQNYGTVKLIKTHSEGNEAFIYNIALAPNTVLYKGSDTNFGVKASTNYYKTVNGGIIGIIYTGADSGWAWDASTGAGISPSSATNNLGIRYNLNLDENSDYVGNAPATSTTNATISGYISDYAVSVKQNDNSPYPFNLLRYAYDDREADATYPGGGAFNTSYHIFTLTPAIDDRFTPYNNVRFLPLSEVNTDLLDRIGGVYATTYVGDKPSGIYMNSLYNGFTTMGADSISRSSIFPYLGYFEQYWPNSASTGGGDLNGSINSNGKTFDTKYVEMYQISPEAYIELNSVQITGLYSYSGTNKTLAFTSKNRNIKTINHVDRTITFYAADNSEYALGIDREVVSKVEAVYPRSMLGFPDVFGSSSLANWTDSVENFTGNFYSKASDGTYYIDPNGDYAGLLVEFFSYSSSAIKYSVNLAASTWSVSNGGYVIDDPTAHKSATVIDTFGPFTPDGKIVSPSGEILADLYDSSKACGLNAGTVRIAIAEGYDPENPRTYVDYQVRILRMQKQEFTEVSTVAVGGTTIYTNSTGDPEIIEIESDPTKVTLYSVEPGDTVVVTYKNLNVEESTTPIVDMPILYEIDDLTYERVEVSTGYTVTLGNQTANTATINNASGGQYNYASGHWVAGLSSIATLKNKTKFTNTVTLTTVSDFPIGKYELVFYLGGGDDRVEYVIKLSRVESTEANILTMVPEYGTATLTNGAYYTTIPYGYYYDIPTYEANEALGTSNPNYDAKITGTKVLDFSDIWTNSYGPISYDDLEANIGLPEYLKALTISKFAVLRSVELIKTGDSYVTYVNDAGEVGAQSNTYYRKQYTIKYTIRAEAYDPLDPGKVPEMVYYHYVTEDKVSLDLIDSQALNTPSKSGIYFTPVKVTNEDSSVNYYEEFVREENPTYNYLHDYSTLYLSTARTFLDRGITVYADKDYVEGIDFIYDEGANGFSLRFYSTAPIGNYEYEAAYVFDYQYTDINSPFYEETFEWSRVFVPIVTSKAGSKISRLETLSFTSETAMATINTIMYPSSMLIDSSTGEIVPMDAELYYNVLTGEPGYPKVINILYGNIDYSNPAVSRNESIFYTVGQVSKTNLEYYVPTFGLPEGAVIARRVPVYDGGGNIIDYVEYIYDPNDEDSDISVLNSNFLPLEDENEFNYVYYRVYAEGYVASVPGLDTLYTDYYISVIDTSNNAFFTFEVIHTTLENELDSVYLILKLFGIPSDSLESDTVELLEFAFFSFFTKENPEDEYYGQYGNHNSQKGSGSGTFYVDVVMPEGYDFKVLLNGELQVDEDGNPTRYFDIPHSVIPVRYTVTIEITPNDYKTDWGQGGIIS